MPAVVGGGRRTVEAVDDGLTDAEIEDRLRAAEEGRWRELWEAVAALDEDPEPGRWAGGERVDGVLQMPYVVYRDAVHHMIRAVYALGANLPFPWPAWGGLQRYPRGRGLDAAPVAESIRLVTAIVRADRFSEGTILACLTDGTLAAVFDRLRRWQAENVGYR